MSAEVKTGKFCLLSNDVETHSIWFNNLRDETGVKVLKEGMPLLLDIYERFGVKSTFFFVGDMAQKFPEVVKMILPYGHEVASHGWSHEVRHGFDVMPYETQLDHLTKSKSLLEDLSGQEVISFRAPALRVNSDTPRALIEAGYRIDSSVASQRFDMFLSFGALKKMKWLTAPRLPYRTSKADLAKKGDSTIVEVPLTALLFPYVGTTMRIMPSFTKLQRRLLHAETLRTGKPMVFDIHPNEFIDESEQHRVIARRTSNPVKYILNDFIRGKLKVKNLGPKAEPLYSDLVSFYQKRSYQFLTIKDYCIKNNLL